MDRVKRDLILQTKNFTRKKEDFICDHCGTTIKGNGYTDHCPYCLWSKHVDISPGDREANCNGLMEPVEAVQENGEWKILYKCQKCGYERKNKTADDDNFDIVLKLSTLHVPS
ncbi:MAG: RNHCP domain-containing protein [bacterium]|nr:RNHCP domain-containing protein [bacterium]